MGGSGSLRTTLLEPFGKLTAPRREPQYINLKHKTRVSTHYCYYYYERKTWRGDLINKCLKKGKCVIHVCRHHSSRENLVKIKKIQSYQPTLWLSATELVESSILYFIFSPGSLHYRHESDRCRTLPFFLTFLIKLSKYFYNLRTNFFTVHGKRYPLMESQGHFSDSKYISCHLVFLALSKYIFLVIYTF